MPRLDLVTNSYIPRMVGVCYIQVVPECARAWLQAANSRIQPFRRFPCGHHPSIKDHQSVGYHGEFGLLASMLQKMFNCGVEFDATILHNFRTRIS